MQPTKKLKILLFILLTSFLVVTSSHAIQTVMNQSKAFQTLSAQAEQTYLKPFGEQMERIYKKDIVNAAMLLGLAMQGQKAYVEANPQYLPQLKELIKETLSFLQVLAQNNNNRNPRDGTYIDNKSLSEQFYSAMMGHLNNWVTQNYHVNPAQVTNPFILSQVAMAAPGEGPGNQVHGKFIEKEDTATIKLLEEDAPTAESGAWDRNAAQGTQAEVGCLLCPGNKPGQNSSYWKGKTSDNSFRMPYKGVKSDDQNVLCIYSYNDSRLSNQFITEGKQKIVDSFTTRNGVYFLYSHSEYLTSQASAVGLIKHGTQIDYSVSENKRVHMITKEYFVNGKAHGKQERYDITPKGETYLVSERQYNNSVKAGTWLNNVYDKKTGKVYFSGEQIFKNGKTFSHQNYGPDGSKTGYGKLVNVEGNIKYRYYNADGSISSTSDPW